ncbi:hypothetical protein [Microbulbifer sediminum]|nr:hypothetical protein [Microbulbifer sediminum]
MTIVKQLLGAQTTEPPIGTECNYDDNYYGDQVCVIRTNSPRR